MDEKILETVGGFLQFGLFIFCLGLVYLTWGVLHDRAIGLKRLTKTDKYDANADWDEAKPVKAGLFGNAHWDVIVTFRDGSRYRTNLGKSRRNGQPIYDDADMKAAIAEATAEHAFYEIGGKDKDGKKELIEEVKSIVTSSAILTALYTVGLPLGIIVGVGFIIFFSNGIRGCVGLMH